MPKTSQVTTTMYVDPAGRLQAADVAVTAQEKGHKVRASIDLTMSHFGTASVPVAPSATQTVTYQQLKGLPGSFGFPLTTPSGVQPT